MHSSQTSIPPTSTPNRFYDLCIVLIPLLTCITGDPASPPFRIESATGSIILTEDLTIDSYKDKSSFKLNVSATDDGSCCESGKYTLIMYVLLFLVYLLLLVMYITVNYQLVIRYTVLST